MRADGTFTIEGVFTRLALVDPGPKPEIQFDVAALLIGGLGDGDAALRLVEPDGGMHVIETKLAVQQQR